MVAKSLGFCVAFAFSLILPAAAQTFEPIRYTLSFPAPETHYVEVEARVPTAGRPRIELMMAVWTPGSYLVREYERHVEQVRAEAGGKPASIERPQKNRWAIPTTGAAAVTVRYRVYSREMGVRSNWVESAFAMFERCTHVHDAGRRDIQTPRGDDCASGSLEANHDRTS